MFMFVCIAGLPDVCCEVFINRMHSVHFYFINTMIMYEFTALLKFTYVMHADLLLSLCTLPFNSRYYSIQKSIRKLSGRRSLLNLSKDLIRD